MASITLAAPPASLPSSSTARRWKYDVFLSFRGPDTRRSFTFELYCQLKNRGIRTFIDDEDLEKGDEISPTLLKAIDESWFAIIVLSKQYASSTWCLEELTKICQSMKDPPKRILPVFYQVEPTDVRYQKGSFEEAFTKHKTSGRYTQGKVQQWRDDLNRVASISGWNTNDYKTDRQLVENIVEVVCKSVQPIAIKNVGFEAIRDELESDIWELLEKDNEILRISYRYLPGERLCISGLENIVSNKDAVQANMRRKKNLKKLVLQWSKGVTGSSEKDRQVLEQLQPHKNLKELKIVSYGGIKFPSWVGDHSFYNLVSVELLDCEFCFSLPPLGQLPSLEELWIERLNGVVSIGSEFYGNNTGGVQPFRSLKSLEINHMLEWQEWVYVGGDQEDEFAIFPNLHLLVLSSCPKLTNTFPLDKIQNLRDVFLWDLKSFAGPLSQESECPKFLSLTKLSINYCPEFVRFSDGGGIDAPKLKSLRILDCVKLGSLPERMHTLLPSLAELEIKNCPELESFAEGGLPPALKSLVLQRNKKLFANRKQWGLPALKSLEELKIEYGSECSSFPEAGLLPACLTHLCLFYIPNLTSIDGKQLRHLNSLQFFWIMDCPKLECFPEEGLPTSLKELKIYDKSGQEWKNDVREKMDKSGPRLLTSLASS